MMSRGWETNPNDQKSYKCYFHAEDGCDVTVSKQMIDAVTANHEGYRSKYGVLLGRYRTHCEKKHRGRYPPPSENFELVNKPKKLRVIKPCQSCSTNSDLATTAVGMGNFVNALSNFGTAHGLTVDDTWLTLVKQGQDISTGLNGAALGRGTPVTRAPNPASAATRQKRKAPAPKPEPLAGEAGSGPGGKGSVRYNSAKRPPIIRKTVSEIVAEMEQRRLHTIIHGAGAPYAPAGNSSSASAVPGLEEQLAAAKEAASSMPPPAVREPAPVAPTYADFGGFQQGMSTPSQAAGQPQLTAQPQVTAQPHMGAEAPLHVATQHQHVPTHLRLPTQPSMSTQPQQQAIPQQPQLHRLTNQQLQRQQHHVTPQVHIPAPAQVPVQPPQASALPPRAQPPQMSAQPPQLMYQQAQLLTGGQPHQLIGQSLPFQPQSTSVQSQLGGLFQPVPQHSPSSLGVGGGS